jgi:hypothetical protein
MRHVIRNSLLTFAYAHPAALRVLLKRGPHAMSAYLKEIYRCSKTDAGLHLPIVSLEVLAPVDTALQIYRPAKQDGSMTITEIASLCQLIAARKPKKILELGTFEGLTTLNMAMNAPEAEIHTLDLPEQFNPADTTHDNNDAKIISRRGFYYYKDRDEARRIHQHYGDSAAFDFNRHVGTGVEFCLIDAAHSYEYVKNDTLKVLPLMAYGSLLLFHDYGRNDFLAHPSDAWGVSRFLHEIAPAGVRILQGTALGVLEINGDSKERILNMLIS